MRQQHGVGGDGGVDCYIAHARSSLFGGGPGPACYNRLMIDFAFIKNLDTAQFLWGAVVVPVLGWLGYFISAMWKRKRRKKALIKFLCGLPIEAKAVLVDFYKDGTHTMRGDPYCPAVCLLVERGVITRGPGGGGYDAADRYLSIRSSIWEVMDDWAAVDSFASKILF